MVAVGPHSWNASVLAVDGDAVTLDVRSKWVNYHDDIWRPIVPTFALDSGKYTHTTSPWSIEAPPLATGRIKLYNDQSYNPHSRSPFTVSTTPTLELAHPDASAVEPYFDPAKPSQVWYLDALGDGVDLGAGIWPARYPRAEHLVRIRKVPAGGASSVTISERIYTPMSMAGGWNGEATDIGTTGAILLPAGVGDTGIVMRPAVAWYYDTEGNYFETPISVIVERRLGAGYVLLSKIIPTWFIAAAIAAGGYVLADETTTTYYPDADAETTTFDGYYQGQGTNATWSAITSAASSGSHNDASNTIQGVAYSSGNTPSRWAVNSRGATGFDTSSIGAGATVTAATETLYGSNKSNSFSSGSPTMGLCKFSPSSATGATASDYGTLVRTYQSDTQISYASWSTTGGNAFVFNAAGLASINTTAPTWLMTVSTNDYAQSQPSWNASRTALMEYYSAEQAGTSSDPKLVVTYTGGGGGGNRRRRLLLAGLR